MLLKGVIEGMAARKTLVFWLFLKVLKKAEFRNVNFLLHEKHIVPKFFSLVCAI